MSALDTQYTERVSCKVIAIFACTLISSWLLNMTKITMWVRKLVWLTEPANNWTYKTSNSFKFLFSWRMGKGRSNNLTINKVLSVFQAEQCRFHSHVILACAITLACPYAQPKQNWVCCFRVLNALCKIDIIHTSLL